VSRREFNNLKISRGGNKDWLGLTFINQRRQLGGNGPGGPNLFLYAKHQGAKYQVQIGELPRKLKVSYPLTVNPAMEDGPWPLAWLSRNHPGVYS